MRTASYTDTSFCAGSYHTIPSEEYRELEAALASFPSNISCTNVRVDYSLIREDGARCSIRYFKDKVPAEELLRVLRCAPPKKNDPLTLDEVQRCWMLSPQDKV